MLRLALSYLFRRPVQLLAVLGVAVGLMALLSVLAVMNGLIDMNREAIRGPLSDLLLIPAVGESVARWEDYGPTLEALPEVAAAAPHLVTYALFSQQGREVGLASTQRQRFSSLQVIGIDPQAEIRVNNFAEELDGAIALPMVESGDPFHTGEDLFAAPGLVVSDSMMNLLQGGIRRGDPGRKGPVLELGALPAVLPPPGEELRPHNTRVQVSATYRSSDFRSAYDRVYMRRVGRNSLHYDLLGSKAADFTEAQLRIAPGFTQEQAKASVLAALQAAGLPRPGGDHGGSLQSWEERSASLLSAIHNERRIMTLVLFFIVVVAAFGLFTTISALVREKVRDIGVLAALGYSPLRRGLLLWLTGGVASALGCLLGLVGAERIIAHRESIETWLAENYGLHIFDPKVYVVDVLPARWDDQAAWTLTLATFAVGLAFTLAPALRAAFLSPVQALRYE